MVRNRIPTHIPEPEEQPQPEWTPFAVDLGQAPEYELDLTVSDVPPGLYRAVATTLTLAIGSNSGDPYYSITFDVVGASGGSRSLSTVLSFGPLALRWTVQRLTVLAGHNIPDHVHLDDEDFQQQFLGREVLLKVGRRQQDGYTEPDVQAILPAPAKERAAE